MVQSQQVETGALSQLDLIQAAGSRNMAELRPQNLTSMKRLEATSTEQMYADIGKLRGRVVLITGASLLSGPLASLMLEQVEHLGSERGSLEKL